MLPAYTAEIDPPKEILKIGSTGFDVTRVQGWLGLHGHGVMVDGDFGPATDHALRAFEPTDDGVVDGRTWVALSQALQVAAVSGRDFGSVPFGVAVARLAQLHLEQKPFEVGGDNKGPWVRHYCRGFEVAWCQGFASTIWLQAARACGLGETPYPLDSDGEMSLYVPWVASSAALAKCLQLGTSDKQVPPGSMFFLRGGSAGYSHTGIVIVDHGDVIETIEGNTNDNGSANGYEVCRRYRRKVSCDFGLSVKPLPVEEPETEELTS